MATTTGQSPAIPAQPQISPAQQAVLDGAIQGQSAPTNLPITAVSDVVTNPREAAAQQGNEQAAKAAQAAAMKAEIQRQFQGPNVADPTQQNLQVWGGGVTNVPPPNPIGGLYQPPQTASQHANEFDVHTPEMNQLPSPAPQGQNQGGSRPPTSTMPTPTLESIHQNLNSMANPDFLKNYNLQPDLLDTLGVALQHINPNSTATTRYQQGLTQALESQKAANAEYAKNLGETSNIQNSTVMDVAKVGAELPLETQYGIEKAVGIAQGTLPAELAKIQGQAYVNLTNMQKNIIAYMNPAMRGNLDAMAGPPAVR